MSSNLVVARQMVQQARELVASSRMVTVRLGDVTVQARATQEENGVKLELMADTPLGPFGGVIYAPQATFENMMAAAAISDVLPRAHAAIEQASGQSIRLLLNR